jgi:hypothetical protein
MKIASLVLACLASGVGAPGYAQTADEDRRELGRELGAVLGWRLMPEVVEERCRKADAEGAALRQQALDAWRQKNASLIRSVDERVAEIAPLTPATASGENAVDAVRRQIRKLIEETLFEGADSDELAKRCREMSDASKPIWNSNGIPHVPGSLAALYDWQIRQSSKQAR